MLRIVLWYNGVVLDAAPVNLAGHTGTPAHFRAVKWWSGEGKKRMGLRPLFYFLAIALRLARISASFFALRALRSALAFAFSDFSRKWSS